MTDLFHKGASITKRISGVAKINGLPKITPRPNRKITRIGTFYDEGDAIKSILLEVADTEESRRRGLMGRKDVPAICGMLFNGLSGSGNFWMKNCLVPLDIAFMDSGGVITKIYSMPVDREGAEHYEYDDDDVSAVEVKMGFMNKWGIVPGFSFSTRELKSGKDD